MFLGMGNLSGSPLDPSAEASLAAKFAVGAMFQLGQVRDDLLVPDRQLSDAELRSLVEPGDSDLLLLQIGFQVREGVTAEDCCAALMVIDSIHEGLANDVNEADVNPEVLVQLRKAAQFLYLATLYRQEGQDSSTAQELRKRSGYSFVPVEGYEMNMPQVDDAIAQLTGQVKTGEDPLQAFAESIQGMMLAILPRCDIQEQEDGEAGCGAAAFWTFMIGMLITFLYSIAIGLNLFC
jgi:hypothetical protein